MKEARKASKILTLTVQNILIMFFYQDYFSNDYGNDTSE